MAGSLCAGHKDHNVLPAHTHCNTYKAVPKLCHNAMLSRATMWGFTATSINKAHKMPAITLGDGVGESSGFRRLAASKSSKPHISESQDCAVNILAAICPAMAGVSKCMNSIGTTMKPTAHRLPHHSAAIKSCSRAM